MEQCATVILRLGCFARVIVFFGMHKTTEVYKKLFHTDGWLLMGESLGCHKLQPGLKYTKGHTQLHDWVSTACEVGR